MRSSAPRCGRVLREGFATFDDLRDKLIRETRMHSSGSDECAPRTSWSLMSSPHPNDDFAANMNARSRSLLRSNAHCRPLTSIPNRGQAPSSGNRRVDAKVGADRYRTSFAPETIATGRNERGQTRRKCREINGSKLCPAAHNGLVTGSSPADLPAFAALSISAGACSSSRPQLRL